MLLDAESGYCKVVCTPVLVNKIDGDGTRAGVVLVTFTRLSPYRLAPGLVINAQTSSPARLYWGLNYLWSWSDALSIAAIPAILVAVIATLIPVALSQ